MKVSINLPIIAITVCVFAAGVFAQAVPTQTPIAVRAITTEQAGDEKMAAEDYAGAIFYYRIQTAWLNGRRGSTDADTLAVRERLAEKMGTALTKMNKLPDIPEKAEFHAAKGAEFVKKAKTPADFAKAVHEFQEAVLNAPWVFDYHFNLAVVYKSAGQFKFALNSLALAKLLSLSEKDRRDVNRLRAEIEAAQEMAALSPLRLSNPDGFGHVEGHYAFGGDVYVHEQDGAVDGYFEVFAERAGVYGAVVEFVLFALAERRCGGMGRRVSGRSPAGSDQNAV